MPLSPSERALFIELADKNKISLMTGWENFSKNQQQPEALVFDITNVKEIQTILAKTNTLNQEKKPQDKLTIRVAAGGFATPYSESFSFTSCVPADIILQLTHKKFQDVSLLNEKKHIVKVGPAIQIGELDKILYEKYKLCLPTSSLIPYVTIAGLTANAGHGTGRDQPSVAGLIRAMTFLKPNGEIERIDTTHPDFENIRGSHMGIFGIMLDIEIECIPACKIENTIQSTNLSGLIGEIQKGLLHQYPYVTIMYIPEYRPSSGNNITIAKWQPVSLDSKNTKMDVALRHFHQKRSIRYSDKFQIEEILSAHPKIIPFYMNYIVSNFALDKDSVSVRPWYDIAHSQTSFPRNLDDAGYLFETNKKGDEVIKALNTVSETLKNYAENKKYPLTYAIYLRFFQGTNGGLSTSIHSENKYICAFDMVSHPSIPGYPDFKRDMQKYFMESLHAKPHWGKHIPLDVNYAEVYGKNYNDFKKTLQHWYQECKMDVNKSPFLNKFHETILRTSEKSTPLFEREKKHPATHEKTSTGHLKKYTRQFFKEINKEKDNPAAKELALMLKKIS